MGNARVTSFLLILALSRHTAQNDKTDGPALAKRAHQVLKANCYRCRGEGGQAEMGVYVLNRDRLVAAKLLEPGNPSKSRLLRRMTDVDDPMPPQSESPRPSKDDIEAVRRWIAAGSPPTSGPPRRDFISDDAVLTTILVDVLKAGKRDRPFLHYFTLTALHNVGTGDDRLHTYRTALSKLLNSLSWDPDIHKPHCIDPAGTVLHINLRNFKWTAASWKAILAAYPYGVTYPSATAKSACEATGCELPSCGPTGSCSPRRGRRCTTSCCGFRGRDASWKKSRRRRGGRHPTGPGVAGGVQHVGGLAEQPADRAPPTANGGYWRSYDFAGNADRRNLFSHPLGPGDGEHDFEADGGEIVFALPNGLNGYMLIDGEGARIDKGPTSIVSDKRQTDRSSERHLVHELPQPRPDRKGRSGTCHRQPERLYAPRGRRDPDPLPAACRVRQATAGRLQALRKAAEAAGGPLGKTEPIEALSPIRGGPIVATGGWRVSALRRRVSEGAWPVCGVRASSARCSWWSRDIGPLGQFRAFRRAAAGFDEGRSPYNLPTVGMPGGDAWPPEGPCFRRRRRLGGA